MPRFHQLILNYGQCRRLSAAAGEQRDQLSVRISSGTVQRTVLKAEILQNDSQSFSQLKVGQKSSRPGSGREVEIDLGAMSAGSTREIKHLLEEQQPTKWFQIRYTVYDADDPSNRTETILTYKTTCP